jgi:hypothetical protein
MAEKLLKNEYETPRACVRGVFLCENMAAGTSVLGAITQESWGADVSAKPTAADSSGDFWMGF